MLRDRDVVFVRRPEANAALTAWAEKIGLKYEGAAFTIEGQAHGLRAQAYAPYVVFEDGAPDSSSGRRMRASR